MNNEKCPFFSTEVFYNSVRLFLHGEDSNPVENETKFSIRKAITKVNRYHFKPNVFSQNPSPQSTATFPRLVLETASTSVHFLKI